MKRYDITDHRVKEKIGLAHFALNLESSDRVNKLTRKLEKSGVTIVSYPRITGDGYYESVVLDPDNNRIELVAKK